MFMCKKCHDKGEKHSFANHIALSYGRCEMCGQTDTCADCKAYKYRTTAEVERP